MLWTEEEEDCVALALELPEKKPENQFPDELLEARDEEELLLPVNK